MRTKHSFAGLEWARHFFSSRNYDWAMTNFTIAVLAVSEFYAAQFPGLGGVQDEFCAGANDEKLFVIDQRKMDVECDIRIFQRRKEKATRAIIRERNKASEATKKVVELQKLLKTL